MRSHVHSTPEPVAIQGSFPVPITPGPHSLLWPLGPGQEASPGSEAQALWVNEVPQPRRCSHPPRARCPLLSPLRPSLPPGRASPGLVSRVGHRSPHHRKRSLPQESTAVPQPPLPQVTGPAHCLLPASPLWHSRWPQGVALESSAARWPLRATRLGLSPGWRRLPFRLRRRCWLLMIFVLSFWGMKYRFSSQPEKQPVRVPRG